MCHCQNTLTHTHTHTHIYICIYIYIYIYRVSRKRVTVRWAPSWILLHTSSGRVAQSNVYKVTILINIPAFSAEAVEYLECLSAE